jgi:hypothetical protein
LRTKIVERSRTGVLAIALEVLPWSSSAGAGSPAVVPLREAS